MIEQGKTPIIKEDTPVLLITAKALFKSQLFPNTKNEFGAFAIVQYGNELGIPPMTALQTMAIISGKICMAGQMMLAIASKNGLEYKILKDTSEECQVQLKFKNNEYVSSFTIGEAKQAGVYRENSGWTKFPKDMLFWRAITRGLRRVCPDLILGLYAKEEIEGAPPLEAEVVGEEGETKTAGGTVEDVFPDSPPEPTPDTPPFDTLYVNQVSLKTGETKGKKWTRYTIHTTDGNAYDTFDSKIADKASEFKLNQTPCTITFSENEKFKTKNITEIQQAREVGEEG